MAHTTLAWDGARRLGPIELGMPLKEVVAVLPGHGSLDITDDDDPPYYWRSDALGLSVQFWREIVIAITAKHGFFLDGANLIGMSADEAIRRGGGEVSRDGGDPIDIVSTTRGLELYEEAGRILMVVLAEGTQMDE